MSEKILWKYMSCCLNNTTNYSLSVWILKYIQSNDIYMFEKYMEYTIFFSPLIVIWCSFDQQRDVVDSNQAISDLQERKSKEECLEWNSQNQNI